MRHLKRVVHKSVPPLGLGYGLVVGYDDYDDADDDDGVEDDGADDADMA